MASVNEARILGNLGKDPELKTSKNGSPICRFSVATKQRLKNQEEKTEWHNVVCFGNLAKICGEHLKKGRLVYLGGRINTRSWEGEDGNTRYITEIVANSVQFLDEPIRSKKAAPSDEGWGD